ncbi:E3 ubiquitin-protein ligase MYCBP2-like isoform X7 [Babylonia areolata]|uniref:E3 ubiquitin-protein ligase MYCBP2-like isoform X7 n=1 Tax=Babylonia areolata TaxID=304850 RepID=UPI003FD5C65C
MAAVAEALPCSRSRTEALLRGDSLSRQFHSLFRQIDDQPSRKKPEKKKGKKKSKSKSKDRKQREKSPELSETAISTTAELHGNASAFTVFASVRQCVLVQGIRDASRLYHLANTDPGSDSESDEDGDEKNKDATIKIPKIVGLGLHGVFELIRETRSKYPELCVKALQALLDLLQGQQPEAMKHEPPEVIEKLFVLLMELSTDCSADVTIEGFSLTSLACSGLISLTIALGDTGKLLTAIKAMLMSAPGLAMQCTQVPGILPQLQKSVQAILLGRAQLPDWFNCGVRTQSHTAAFPLPGAAADAEDSVDNCAIASDGCYLYILNKKGLMKMGSGYGGTIKGSIVCHKEHFRSSKTPWLAYAKGKLLCKLDKQSSSDLVQVDTCSLEPTHSCSLDGNCQSYANRREVPLPTKGPALTVDHHERHGVGPSLLFSDGDNIGQIAPAKEQDSFVVRTFSPQASPMKLLNEIPLKLTRKCLDMFGSNPAVDGDFTRKTVVTGFDEDTLTMSSGKDFSLIKTVGGKVLFSGKAASLGIKQGGPALGKWAELPITKSPKIVQVATGHDSAHALMLADDGSVFFVGMAKRGEDGDSGAAKGRRQPKPVKPKKMIRLENKQVLFVACNSGSSAVVSKDGEVYMFGKDTSHCDHASGHVTDLKDVMVTQVALGKAHTVALTAKGQIFTFGINNKGQCGRDFTQTGVRETGNNVTMTEEEDDNEGDDQICPPGKHKWDHTRCMICTVCHECTGYGVGCINSTRNDRNPGMPCGCGAGDSGCIECGICWSCSGEKLGLEELDDQGLLEVIGKGKKPMPLDAILGAERPMGKGNDARKVKKNELRQAQKLIKKQQRADSVPESKDKKKKKEKKLAADSVPESKDKKKKKEKKLAEGVGESEADYTKVVSLAPAEVVVGTGDIPVTQIACGVHHTVVLLHNGDVYTFGNNSYGQLGQGDMVARGMPTKVPLPIAAVQIAAGSHHTVVLLSSGQVYTFGDYQKLALGRSGPEDTSVKSKKGAWHCVPGPVPGVGARFGRRATWVGASADQTFMRIDESLINALTLQKANIFASQSCIGLIPRGENNAGIVKCLMISKVDGSCKSFSGEDQVDLSGQVVCLDPVYDILWGYSPQSQEIHSYNVLVPEARSLPSIQPGYPNILSAELAVPVHMGYTTTRSHCALHMLGCLDTLTIAQQLKLEVLEEAKEKTAQAKVYTKEDYSVVNRFESHGGGWGYSGHSVEAIRFMCDTDILLGGFGLFGGRGEYLGRIKVFELGVDGGDNETDGEMLAETDEVPYECGAREKFCMLFEEPVPLMANCWYVAWARISGPSSDCGSSGQPSVCTEDQVMFKFKSSKKSNNGTDVNAGQIPQLLYRLPSRDSPSVVRRAEHVDPAHILSQDFSHTVSEHCFEAVLQLLDWSWTASHSAMEIDGLKGDGYQAALADMSRLVYIARTCLRLLRIYVNEVYPDGVTKKKVPPESSTLAQRIGDGRDILRRILAGTMHAPKFKVFLGEPSMAAEFREMREEILKECHDTFRSCFHAFYPTGQLKWWCLCDLLLQMEPIFDKKEKTQKEKEQGAANVSGVGRLLAAVMEALCHPAIKLTAIMPINCEPETEAVLRRQSMCMDDNTNSVARLGEGHRYPVLASHMSYRMEVDSIGGSSVMHVSFKEVLDRLLMLVALPVRQVLAGEQESFPSHLVANTCYLLATIISELAASSMGLEVDIDTSTRPLLVTPNRFTRMTQIAFWNTGNGSPDAVAFSVDRPGIVLAGVCVYGGSGTYEYEVELLVEASGEASGEVKGEVSHTQRWNSLEVVKGTFGPDDTVNLIAEIKFEQPIPIREGTKYALKLQNTGQRTYNGDGGMAKVKCSDGTTFTFSACSLSVNGTNHVRGQIPQILYYSAPQEGDQQSQHAKTLAELQARKNAIDITGAICRTATELLHCSHNQSADGLVETLGNSHLFSSLLPLSLAYVGPVAAQDPRGAVQVLYLIQEILPAVVALTKQLVPLPLSCSVTIDSSMSDVNIPTTSQHYAVIESDHPYKPATVANYKLEFPNTVRWMVIEFDPQCATAQAEDSLQLYIPAWRTRTDISLDSEGAHSVLDTPAEVGPNYWPVLNKFHGANSWPKQSIVLPGCEVLFSLETASDYLKDEKASFFGFKCTVIGYEWNSKADDNVLLLEKELTYLGGMCSASLMRRDIPLPPVTMEEMEEDLDLIEEGAQMVFEAHSQLLGKGFALSHPPTIMQALEGNLPFCWQSNERAFLKDFVACTAGTSGGRLAKWLQPDSYLDPKNCEIVCNVEDLKCNWPAIVTILTRDQYGQLVHVPNLKVEVRAVPVDRKENFGDDLKKMRRLSRPDDGDMTFGGLPAPQLDVPYEVTVKDRKDVFHAITVMKAYENYSFEELRFAAPTVPRPSENMLVRANTDGTLTANWTPGCVGYYNIHVVIDGFDAGEPYKVEVKEPPQGAPPPVQNVKKSHPPNKMRKFVAKYSAGLRVRSHPSLQSEQLGVIKPEGVISFLEEVHNDDGVWLRLSPESMREWCEGLVGAGAASGNLGLPAMPEAWCLQYNQHLGKTLLAPVEEPRSIVDEMVKEQLARKLPEYIRGAATAPKGPGVYQVVNCGIYGHNIRSYPSMTGSPIGILNKGMKIVATESVINKYGVWVKLDEASRDEHCSSENKDCDAWSLVSNPSHSVYLQHESDLPAPSHDPFSFNTLPSTVRTPGYDFQNYAATFPTFGHRNPEGFGRSRSMPAAAFSFAGTDAAAPGSVPTFGMPMGGGPFNSMGPGAAFTPPQPTTSGATWMEASGAGAGSGIGVTASVMRPRSGSTPFFTPATQPLGRASPVMGSAARKGSDPGVSRLTVRDAPRDLPPELQGVSVKELVKALGESRANGNGPTPQPSPPGSPKKSSRSSSPRAAGSSRSASPATSSDSRRGSTSPSPMSTLTRNETFQTPPSSPMPRRARGRLEKEPSFERSSLSPSSQKAEVGMGDGDGGMFGGGAGGMGSPRFSSPVRMGSPGRRGSFTSTQLGGLGSSPPRGEGGSPMAANFNIGSGSPKDEVAIRLSPKAGRKDRGRQLRSKRERASSPSARDAPFMRARSSSASLILDRAREPVKQALSPSVAECLRAVFAAFMWHEGIVHDAMACASFLKFHPDLTKAMSQFVKGKAKTPERVRQRHATDSSKDKRDSRERRSLGQGNLNETRVRFNLEPQVQDVTEADRSFSLDKTPLQATPPRRPMERHKSESSSAKFPDFDAEKGKDGGLKEETVLPPTLQHLVYFWEELALSILKVISQEVIMPSPAIQARIKKVEKKDEEKKEKKSKRKKEKQGVAKGGMFGETVAHMLVGLHREGRGAEALDHGAAAAAAAAVERAAAMAHGGGQDRETMCELCGGVFPNPVTYHMRQMHPGCGRHAFGKGYNSSGSFCGGWAGNCGEGGMGGSSWYLMCDRCREKYLKEKRHAQKEKEKSRKLKKKVMGSYRQQAALSAHLEAHLILKENAMFLLDLASASGLSLPKQNYKKQHVLQVLGISPKQSDMFLLPSVSETLGTELEPFPPTPFQYLSLHNAGSSDTAFAEDVLIDDDERVFVRSGSLSISSRRTTYRPRLPTEPRHSPLARSGSLGQDVRPFSHIMPDMKELRTPTVENKPMVKSAGTSPESEQENHKKSFHRSVSEYASEEENAEHEFLLHRAVSVSARRRNNSGGVSDGGVSLLKHPSAAMGKLISSVDRSKGAPGNGERALQRPVMEFIVQRHDLDGLQLAMKQALRKAACRVFAMQAFNWLLRNVVQQTSLHDLLWFFVVSMMPSVEEEEETDSPEGDKEKKDKKDQEEVPLCEHPLSDICVAGKAVAPLPETFHALLQSISDAMLLLPIGSALQRMAVQCYCVRFAQSDHQFLHESHVFSNISRILSKSEEENDDSSIDSSLKRKRHIPEQSERVLFSVSALKDLTPAAEIKASSRQAMIGSLSDNSTETFWESGDEDRNRVKTLNIVCSNKANPSVIYIHIDNSRDLANKVNNVSVSTGTTTEDMKKIRSMDVEARFAGWLNCAIPAERRRHIHIELKGPDQSLRVRQIKVLGTVDDEAGVMPVKKTSLQIQQDNCESETLKVFRILTSQVFGRLITTGENGDKKDGGQAMDVDNDLKEHMVSILFSRNKLSHLQKQVCAHIVDGIRKEAARVREEWDNSGGHPPFEDGRDRASDGFCFELLSMVEALSGSPVGRRYLAQQYSLIQDLFSLLHTASPRIQRQIVAIFRRVLPDVKPPVLANLLSVPSLPPMDYSIVSVTTKEEGDSSFDTQRPGILDVFLACIAKALVVQVKTKLEEGGKSQVTLNLDQTMAQDGGTSVDHPRWWLRGFMPNALANNIITLLQDMTAGKLSEAWANITKAAIAEAILNLTKLDAKHRGPDVCPRTPTMWLALASLCVLGPDHVERLSSGEWVSSPDSVHGKPRPTCDNHDDSVTPAIILCAECGNLCADCDRFLHLPRKMRSHQRQVFKEEEEAIKVDLHEGCGRTKLFWVMALADSKTLKAMVEFRVGKQHNAAATGTCRFCGSPSSGGLLALGNVCSDPDCQNHAKEACVKTLDCGHPCGGILDEEQCLPCLHRCRPADQDVLKQDADDMCMICFTEALSAAPAIQLKCGHVFHLHCTRMVLEKRWVGPRITFGFSLCPICKCEIEHKVLRYLLDPLRQLYDDVRRKALMRLEYEGLHKADAITRPGGRFFEDPASFAMERYAYYVCYKCNKAYYGGEARCEEQAGGGDVYDPKELVCGGCSDVSRAQMCPKHGSDFLEYKCRYCCSVAVFFCFGTTHFCNQCHDDFQRVTNIPKTSLPHCPAGPRGRQLEGEECPLHVQHPPTGEEFALGCGVCRNAHTF